MPEFHAKISPSSFKRVRLCPASLRYTEALMRDGKIVPTSSAAAEQGTAQHEVVERMLDGEIFTAPWTAGNGITLETEDILAAEEVVDWVQAQDFTKIWNEQKLPVGEALGLNNPDICWGTSDIIALDPVERTLHVIDAKFGFVPVSPKDNDQALLYSVGAAYIFEHLPFDKINNVIVQPKVGGAKQAQVTLEELEAYKQEARAIIAKAQSDEAEFNPGEDQCRFCPASGQCRAQIEEDFEELDTIEFEVITNEEIAHWLERSAHLSSTLKALAGEAMRRMEVGQDIPGWVRDRGQARAKWVDVDEVVNVLAAEGLDLDQYAPRSPITQTALKKVLGKAKVEALVSRPEGQPKLVRREDAKNPIDPEFTPL